MESEKELAELNKRAKRFWKWVAKAESDECWEWTGSRNERRYGKFRVFGKTHRSHRLAWVLANQQLIPADMVICHHCDNPPCCNPKHLFLGTVQDNTLDALAKGLMARRPGRNGAILSMESAKEIREQFANGVEVEQLCKEYGASRQAIGYLLRGRNWKAAGGPTVSTLRRKSANSKRQRKQKPKKGLARGERNGSAKLTEEAVIEIRYRYSLGDVSQAQLSAEYKVGGSCIHAIVTGKKWKHTSGPITRPGQGKKPLAGQT